MKRTLKQILKIAGFLSLGIFLLYFAFKGIALDKLLDIIREANFWWIGLSLFFAFIAFLSRARRWVLLIEPLGYKPGFINTYHSLMIGYLANFALPRLGEVTRCVTLGRKEKIPVDSLIGTVIVERAIDVLMLLLILCILLINWLDKFGTFFSQQVFIPIREKILGVFGGTLEFYLILLFVVLLAILVLYLTRNRLAKIKFIRNIRKILKGILEGLTTIFQMKRKWEFLFHSFFIWFCYIMMTWVVVFAIKATSHLGFIDGIFLLVVGGLGMSAPVTGGFGAYHWITSRGLVYVYGMTLEQGGAYAILAHESNSLFTIILGTLSFILLFLTNSKKGIKDGREAIIVRTDQKKDHHGIRNRTDPVGKE